MIKLKKIEEYDLQLLRSWRNDDRIMKWCRQNDLLSSTDQVRWYEKINIDPTIKMYLITTLIKGCTNCIGVCGLTSIDLINSRAEFSLYIAPEYQNKGYGKTTLITLLNKGFNDFNLNLIWGETFNKNPAYKMFKSLGFKKEGTRRQFYYKNGKYVDAHLVSILRKEWRG